MESGRRHNRHNGLLSAQLVTDLLRIDLLRGKCKVTIRPGYSRTVLYFWVLSWISLCPGFVLDLKPTKFCQLILSKIIKIVATRCQISRLKCTKFDFGWGSAPDSAGGAYSAPQTP